MNKNTNEIKTLNAEEREVFFEEYNRKTHIYGRTGLCIGIALMLVFPFAAGLILGAMPDIPAFWKGFVQVAAIYIPSCVAEFLIYTPMLGAGGSYLAFITGNLINMKIPCMISARDIVGVKAGTPENEIVAALAIATSALTTTAVVALGVLLLIPLSPILENPVLAPAFDNVVPALFGALAWNYFRKDLRIVALPLLVMSVLFMCVPALIGEVGFMIIPSGAMAIGTAWILFKKENKSTESDEMAASASNLEEAEA